MQTAATGRGASRCRVSRLASSGTNGTCGGAGGVVGAEGAAMGTLAATSGAAGIVAWLGEKRGWTAGMSESERGVSEREARGVGWQGSERQREGRGK